MDKDQLLVFFPALSGFDSHMFGWMGGAGFRYRARNSKVIGPRIFLLSRYLSLNHFFRSASDDLSVVHASHFHELRNELNNVVVEQDFSSWNVFLVASLLPELEKEQQKRADGGPLSTSKSAKQQGSVLAHELEADFKSSDHIFKVLSLKESEFKLCNGHGEIVESTPASFMAFFDSVQGFVFPNVGPLDPAEVSRRSLEHGFSEEAFRGESGIEANINKWLKGLKRPSQRNSWRELLRSRKHYIRIAVQIYLQLTLVSRGAYRMQTVEHLQKSSELLALDLDGAIDLFSRSTEQWKLLGEILLSSSSPAHSAIWDLLDASPDLGFLYHKQLYQQPLNSIERKRLSVFESRLQEIEEQAQKDEGDMDINRLELKLEVMSDTLQRIVELERDAFTHIQTVLQITKYGRQLQYEQL